MFTDPHLFLVKLGHRFRGVRKQLVRQYFNVAGKTLPPTEVSFCLTQRCNLRCPMCGQWGEHGWLKAARGVPELTLDELKRVIDDVAYHRPNISIWGGEPMLRPDLFEFIRYIKSKKMNCSIVTNGTLLLQYAEQVLDSGLDYLYLSLDGPEEIHDAIRGKGTFHKAVEGLRRVHALRQERKKAFPRTNLNTLIMGSTYRHLETMANLGIALGVNSHSFAHAWAIPGSMGTRHAKLFQQLFQCEAKSWEGFRKDEPDTMDLDELVKIILRLNALRDRIPGFHLGFLPHIVTEADIKRYYQDVTFTPHRSTCHSPWFRADIRPNGDVSFCLDYPDYLAGNVRDASFSTVWNGPKALAFRQQLNRFKKFPICTRCCQMYID
jgi:MoaA/NifB/PqqE/SkfB family radical SAM enzyme